MDKNKPKDYLLEVASAIGVQFVASDIRSVVMQSKLCGKGTSTCKVEFKDSDKKFELMRNKSKMKDNQELANVSIFDVLSRDSAELFKSAKGAKSKGYKFIYHRNGKIFVKADENRQPIHIPSKKDIINLPFLVGHDPPETQSSGSGITNQRASRRVPLFENADEDDKGDESAKHN